jgi:hypothetical protein
VSYEASQCETEIQKLRNQLLTESALTYPASVHFHYTPLIAVQPIYNDTKFYSKMNVQRSQLKTHGNAICDYLRQFFFSLINYRYV